jgi:xanthine dehydrogenase YagS FAD-binding subunit
MHDVGYVRVTDPDEALGVLAEVPDARVIAGGTDVVNLLKTRVDRSSLLVDINALPLREVHHRPDGLRIGALVTMSDAAADCTVRERYPLVVQALEQSASPQVRNMATLGGNLLQRTRCPYFRAEGDLPCNKRSPGSGCAVTLGYGRDAALFGGNDACRATLPSDLAVALAALDAAVVLRSPRGERTVPVRDLHLLTAARPDRETVLAHDELVVAIDVPAPSGHSRSHYLKLRERSSYQFALLSAAVVVEVHGGHIVQARIALGGVAPTAWRLDDAERRLPGTPLDDAALRAAVAPSFESAQPHPDNLFKIELGRRAVVRALTLAGRS